MEQRHERALLEPRDGLASGPPDIVYGEGLKSNYQGQGVKLGKHFKPWAV
jgi:2'-deoxycytidine 5'-triphosphate deaminase DCD